MAVSTVSITGDTSNLTLRASNLSGPDPLEYLSGAFRGSPDEKRLAAVFFVTGGGTKTFEVRFEFVSQLFVEHSVTGVPVYVNVDDQPGSGSRVSIESEARPGS